jgi:hypothetical protein
MRVRYEYSMRVQYESMVREYSTRVQYKYSTGTARVYSTSTVQVQYKYSTSTVQVPAVGAGSHQMQPAPRAIHPLGGEPRVRWTKTHPLDPLDLLDPKLGPLGALSVEAGACPARRASSA